MRRSQPRIARNAEPVIIYEPSESESEDEEELGTGMDTAVMNERSRLQPIPSNNGGRRMVFHTEKYFEMPDVDDTGVSQTVMVISLFASLFFSINGDSSDLLLRLLKCLVDIMLKHTTWEEWKRQILVGIPKSFKTVRSRYHVDDTTRFFAVCPICHETYEGQYDNDVGEVVYPEVCTTSANSNGPPCGTSLLHTDGMTPVKKFVYSPVVAFIGSLVSRKSIEQSIDEACDNLRSSSIPNPCSPFQAEFLRRFEGHDHSKLFIDRGNELRLAFSLNIDFFYERGVRSDAANVRYGIISVICLNLPEDVRYKDENMHLAGIIPGPKEPSITEMNRYLAPLVQEFLELWDPGVYFTRTPSAPQGRLCRAAIALVVCDLPVARNAAGLFGSDSTEFVCSHCKCPKAMISDVDVAFESRDGRTLRQKAEEWRDAKMIARRKAITRTHGVRWSEIWRLPYWDPTKQLIIDPMHCLLSGLVSNHFLSIFPLTEDSEVRSAKVPYEHDFAQIPTVGGRRAGSVHIAGEKYEVNARIANDVLDIHRTLILPIDPISVDAERSRLRDGLQKKHSVALMFVADSLGLHDASSGSTARVGKKLCYVNALVEWRLSKPLQASIQLTTPALLRRVRHVLETTSTPTVVKSVPKNFRTASAGMITMDEWHTLCTICFPIALMSHYVSAEITDRAFKDRYRSALEHTMELVQAVNILFTQSTSGIEATKYKAHIKKYISGLQAEHSTASITPNMHMSLHIAEFLPQFGSVCSWWTFPSERLTWKAQDAPTNSKLGQFQGTMLSSLIALSRMKHLISQDSSHDGVKACIQVVREVLEKDGLSAPLEDADGQDDSGDKTLLDEIHPTSLNAQEMLNWHADRLVRRVKWNNIEYCVGEECAGNSQIGFRLGNTILPGIIQHIFKGVNPIFIVRPFLDGFDNINDDPFSKFPDYPMSLRILDPGVPLEVISCHAVVGQFAAYHLDDARYVLRPLF